MSHTGQCYECGQRALAENMIGISLHQGPAFQRWRHAMLAAFGGVPVDELREGR